jgi:hypothetical protein
MESILQKAYLRIQDRWVGKTGKPVGIFAVCWYHCNEKIFSTEEIAQFHEIRQWFLDKLPVPECYNEDGNQANTWFKTPQANTLILKLEPLMALLDKYHRPYDIILTDHPPGEIIYEDDYQVGVR